MCSPASRRARPVPLHAAPCCSQAPRPPPPPRSAPSRAAPLTLRLPFHRGGQRAARSGAARRKGAAERGRAVVPAACQPADIAAEPRMRGPPRSNSVAAVRERECNMKHTRRTRQRRNPITPWPAHARAGGRMQVEVGGQSERKHGNAKRRGTSYE
eukprot:362825-Chlamydomonas_euryale.AAC.6